MQTRFLQKLSGKVFKYSKHLSALLFVSSIVWFGLFSKSSYSKNTYISENALLPGQMQTAFGNSERFIRQRTQKLRTWIEEKDPRWALETYDIFRELGLEAELTTTTNKNQTQESTVHGIIRATRSDAVESIAFSSLTTAIGNQHNANGIMLLLGLANEFSQQNYWSKDIVFVITDQGERGIYNWLESQLLLSNSAANHKHRVSGLQAAIAFELPQSSSYRQFALYYEGKNGQLPNLDLPNTIRSIFGYSRMETLHHGSKVCSFGGNSLSDKLDHYKCMFSNLGENMKWLAFGTLVGTHAPFLDNRIESVTIRGIPENNNKEIDHTSYVRIGSVMESATQSINNILERFHQSFYLYLLPENGKYISIGDYVIPSILAIVALLLQGVYLFDRILTGSDSSDTETRFDKMNSVYANFVGSMRSPLALFLCILGFSALSLQVSQVGNRFSGFSSALLTLQHFALGPTVYGALVCSIVLIVWRRSSMEESPILYKTLDGSNWPALKFVINIYTMLYLLTLTIVNYSLGVFYIATVGTPLLLISPSVPHSLNLRGSRTGSDSATATPKSEKPSKNHKNNPGSEEATTSVDVTKKLILKLFYAAVLLLSSPPVITKFALPFLVNLGCEKINYCMSDRQVLNWLYDQHYNYGSQAYLGLYMLQIPVNLACVIVTLLF